jgi:hypothetical protein
MSFISALRGSARMLRLPSARGPNSEPPWNQPMMLPSASIFAVSLQMSGLGVALLTAGPSLVHRVLNLLVAVGLP